jgi:hypothetical protein
LKNYKVREAKQYGEVEPGVERVLVFVDPEEHVPDDAETVLRAVEPELTARGIVAESAEFDVMAGCSCGCSPGYTVKTERYVKDAVLSIWLEPC